MSEDTDRFQQNVECEITSSFDGTLLLFSCSVVSNSLRPRGLQHARPPCPLSPGICSDSCPFSQGCHPTSSSSALLGLRTGCGGGDGGRCRAGRGMTRECQSGGEHSVAACSESTHGSLATLGPAVSHDLMFTCFHYGLLVHC